MSTSLANFIETAASMRCDIRFGTITQNEKGRHYILCLPF
jgi:hypothetical protein